jgi:uncharacterized protein YbaR (Trm112 family)
MNLEQLSNIIACPQCHNALQHRDRVLWCEYCDCEYPLTANDNTPILFSPAGKERVARLEAEFACSVLSKEWHPSRLPILTRLLTAPSPTLNVSLPRIGRIFREHLSDSSILLFVGGMRASDYKFFAGPQHVALDIVPARGVDLLGDAQELPIRDACVDGFIAQALLEHVPSPDLILQHGWRVLRPGGLIYVAVPFMQPYHYGPLDYRRYTLDELEIVMRRYEKIEDGVASGPGSSLAWLIRVYVGSFATGPVTHRVLDALGGWIGFLFKFTDLFLARRPRAALAACAFYYVGRKPLN